MASNPPKRYEGRAGILLALDPSPNGLGHAVLDFEDMGARLQTPISYNEFKQHHLTDIPLAERGLRAAKQVRKLIRDYQPEVIVMERIEGVVFAKGGSFDSNTAMIKLVGAIEAKADELAIPVSLVTPRTWKAYCNIATGKGHPRHEQKQMAIAEAKLFYHDIIFLSDGAAEALLIGRYYAEKVALKELRQMRLL